MSLLPREFPEWALGRVKSVGISSHQRSRHGWGRRPQRGSNKGGFMSNVQDAGTWSTGLFSDTVNWRSWNLPFKMHRAKELNSKSCQRDPSAKVPGWPSSSWTWHRESCWHFIVMYHWFQADASETRHCDGLMVSCPMLAAAEMVIFLAGDTDPMARGQLQRLPSELWLILKYFAKT